MNAGGKNRLNSALPEEASQDPRELWRSAYAGTDFLGTKTYLVLLALRDDPTRMIYAELELNRFGVQIDIPLEDRTPEEELRQSVNLHPTLWGDIDPAGYREATETYTRESLVAFLNRVSTGANKPEDVPDKFYEMLHVSHGRTYDEVHVSSHGSDRSFNATIESWAREFRTDLKHAPEDVQIDQAMGFARLVEESLPHLTVTPLPANIYVQEVQAALGYLPQS